MATKLQELACQKEQELHLLREQHQHALEVAIKSCQDELKREQEKRKALEEDFKYNLTLIDQRDHDLVRYEVVFQELKKVVNTRVGEVSDLRVQIDELQHKLKDIDEEKGQLKKYYVQRLEQQQTHMDQYCKSKDTEVTQQRTEYERLQKQLQQRLLQVEEELEMEKQRMISERDDCLKNLEQDHRVKLDELTANLLSKESHLRQLQRELSLAQNTVDQKHKDATSVEERVRELDKELREVQWNHTDEINTHQSRITELEGQLSHAETTIKNLHNEFNNRRVDLERLAREKETALQSSKESHRVRETELEKEIGELRANLEQMEIEARRKEWTHGDEIKEKELQIERLQGDLLKTREDDERLLAHHAQEKVHTDLQIQSLQTSCEKLRTDLTSRIEDIERYKHELHLAAERERSIERSKSQMELDWQIRLEDMERSQYGRQEELVKTLTSARDHSVAQCKQLEEKLMDRVRVCESLRQERDISLDVLQRKGLTDIAREILDGRGSTVAMETLQRQNQELRQVIGHMRNEMEKLVSPEDAPDQTEDKEMSTNPQYKLNKGYVLYLENEVSSLQNENQQLRESLSAKSRKPPMLPRKTGGVSGKEKVQHDPRLAHVLKTALASLQKEKATYEFDLAQLRSHVRELEVSIKSQQQQAYIQKALQVPKDKVQEKLLQATNVIIQLVGEKEVMKRKETELTNQIRYLEQRVRELEEEKRDDLNVHEEVLYDNVCEETHESHITDQSNCGNGTYRHVLAKPHITDQSNCGNGTYRHVLAKPHITDQSNCGNGTYRHVSAKPHITDQSNCGNGTYRHVLAKPHITDQSNCGNGTYRHVLAKPHMTDQSNHGTCLSIHPSTRQPLHIQNHSKIFGHLEKEEQSHVTKMQPLVDFSLSPLKFTDTSSSSGLYVLENALQLVDDGSVELPPQSTPVKGSVPGNGKENHVTHPLIVEGSQVTQISRGGIKGRSQGGYKGPPSRQSRRPKIRNYNIKD